MINVENIRHNDVSVDQSTIMADDMRKRSRDLVQRVWTPTSTVDKDPFAGPTRVRGPASGDPFKLLYLIWLIIDWKHSLKWHLTSNRPAQRAHLSILSWRSAI